jgi:glutathione peroxidase
MLSKKVILISIPLAVGLFAFLSEKLSASKKDVQVSGSFYDFRMKSLEGEEIDFSSFKGKAVVVVNTASKCGFTPQYKDLQKLHETYGPSVVFLGFPANNFLWQEPGSNEEIATFCERNYGVTFQMFEKISVKGKDQHPLYAWLEKKSGHQPSWNFCKYIIDKNGEVAGFFPARVKPSDPEFIQLLESVK